GVGHDRDRDPIRRSVGGIPRQCHRWPVRRRLDGPGSLAFRRWHRLVQARGVPAAGRLRFEHEWRPAAWPRRPAAEPGGHRRRTDRLHRRVDDLLLLARTDAEAVELATRSMDLADAGSEALVGLSAMAGERDVRLRLDVEPTPVTGDPDRLRQLVTILVVNAIR